MCEDNKWDEQKQKQKTGSKPNMLTKKTGTSRFLSALRVLITMAVHHTYEIIQIRSTVCIYTP